MTQPSDTRTIDDLRVARTRGEEVSKADFNAAAAREEARMAAVLAESRERRAAYDPYAAAEERTAARVQAREDAEQAGRDGESDVDALRLARQARHLPGGAPLAGSPLNTRS